MDDVGRVALPLPPLADQERIVIALEQAMSEVRHLAEVRSKNDMRCTRLRQSILKWAFEGRLVDQDPTDEPASLLLERIRAERVGAPPRVPGRSRDKRAPSP